MRSKDDWQKEMDKRKEGFRKERVRFFAFIIQICAVLAAFVLAFAIEYKINGITDTQTATVLGYMIGLLFLSAVTFGAAMCFTAVTKDA